MGLVLKIPTGKKLTYELRFDFQTSKNKAEYESIFAGMRVAKEMGAEAVEALSDSMLTTDQINGFYEVRDGRLQKYYSIPKSTIKLSSFNL